MIEKLRTIIRETRGESDTLTDDEIARLCAYCFRLGAGEGVRATLGFSAEFREQYVAECERAAERVLDDEPTASR